MIDDAVGEAVGLLFGRGVANELPTWFADGTSIAGNLIVTLVVVSALVVALG